MALGFDPVEPNLALVRQGLRRRGCGRRIGLQMNVALREWETDALGVESALDRAGDVGLDGPVVGRFDPRSAEQINRRVGQFGDVHCEFRVFQNERMRAGNFVQEFGCFSNVVVVADPEDKIDSAGALGCEIDDRVAPGFLVGDDDDFIVGRGQFGRNEAHFLDGPFLAGEVNEVPDVEWPVNHDHQSAGETSQRFLQCKTDDEAARPEGRHQWSDLDAHHGEGH